MNGFVDDQLRAFLPVPVSASLEGNRTRTEVDLSVEAPFDFDKAFAKASVMELAPGLSATFVSYEGLLQLKNTAGRPRDMEDIARLKALREGTSDA